LHLFDEGGGDGGRTIKELQAGTDDKLQRMIADGGRRRLLDIDPEQAFPIVGQPAAEIDKAQLGGLLRR
jgi:hypothetical protein